MRLSIDKDDRGYSPEAIAHCKVLLNGVDVTNRCFTADEEEGKVWCVKWNELGKAFVDPSGNIAKEVLEGRVEILLDEGINGRDSYTSH